MDVRRAPLPVGNGHLMPITEFHQQVVAIHHKWRVGDVIKGRYAHQESSQEGRYRITGVQYGVHGSIPNYTFVSLAGGGAGWDFIDTLDQWELVLVDDERTVNAVLRDSYIQEGIYWVPKHGLAALGIDPQMKLSELKERLAS